MNTPRRVPFPRTLARGAGGFAAAARFKVRAHWQSDVLASHAIGTAIGWYAHSRVASLSVGLLPHGVTVGWKESF